MQADNFTAPWLTPQGKARSAAKQRFQQGRNQAGAQVSTDFYSYTLNFGNIAPGASAVVVQQIEADAIFEWIGTAASNQAGAGRPANNNSGTLLMQVTDGGSSRNLLYAPAPMYCVTGLGQLPHILPIPRRFFPKSAVTFIVTNIDTAITYNDVSINLIGRKIYSGSYQKIAPSGSGSGPTTPATSTSSSSWMNDQPPGASQFNSWKGSDGNFYTEDYYGYVFNLATLAAGATEQVTIVAEADSDFEWITATSSVMYNTTTGAPNVSPEVDIQVMDGGSQRNLFSNPINLLQIMGYGLFPFILPQTRLFTAKTPIVVTFTNYDANPYNNLFVVMEGRKIFQLD